ncbi:flagellar basal body-associated FliL family protein [Magnetospirillum molischianum]|uniref:Flagellar protein FliL n=1 Tax=Magnetospirillum molischianum DSM 120 TaxID=1150626 RepID=H8FPS4_MAGML|nr:flagellar basal body-associated FliL family protein [Magnetospirillum molischianum]CCG40362.1 Flagellar basal body-associated protein [Magnetospirillum molischianum DSM 120]
MTEDLEEDFDDNDGAESGAEPSQSKGGLKKILLIVLPILLLVGGGAGLYFSGILDKLLGGHKEEASTESSAPSPVAKAVQAAAFMDLPEMLVNLQTSGRKQAFLKLRVALELESVADQPRVEQMMPRIVDYFQVYLRELRIEDLQGASGMNLLREELLTRVNAAVKPVKVSDVLFKEMLVQ